MFLLSALPVQGLLHVPRLLRGAGAEAGALRPVQLALLLGLARRAVRALAVLETVR